MDAQTNNPLINEDLFKKVSLIVFENGILMMGDYKYNRRTASLEIWIDKNRVIYGGELLLLDYLTEDDEWAIHDFLTTKISQQLM